MIFRSRGSDTTIGKDTIIFGEVAIAPNSVTAIDGQAYLSRISEGASTDGKVAAKTTLRVGGVLSGPADIDHPPLDIEVHNVIITGKVVCKTIRVEGTLEVKAGATLKAEKILYRELIIETGAVVHGQMSHLDHVSEGEIV